MTLMTSDAPLNWVRDNVALLTESASVTVSNTHQSVHIYGTMGTLDDLLEAVNASTGGSNSNYYCVWYARVGTIDIHIIETRH